ncbi:MAG: STAS domain-containing protein [Acidimicrobiales bacterium]
MGPLAAPDADGADRCWLDRFSITIGSRAGDDIVSLRGELDLASAGALHECLASVRAHKVVIDVRRLAFIDAAGMSALVVAHARTTAAGRTLVVRGARDGVRRVLVLGGLVYLFEDAP